MKFMGKWVIWSHAADGYVIPTEAWGTPPTMLYAKSSANINDAVYNIYGGQFEGELLLQANTLDSSPGCWIQCKANGSDPTQSVIPTANGNTELYAAPSLTRTQAAFHQKNLTLRCQASAPQNFFRGYVRFVIVLDGSALDVYGAAVRIERLGDKNQLQIVTETCNVTQLGVTKYERGHDLPQRRDLERESGAVGAELGRTLAEGNCSAETADLRAHGLQLVPGHRDEHGECAGFNSTQP